MTVNCGSVYFHDRRVRYLKKAISTTVVYAIQIGYFHDGRVRCFILAISTMVVYAFSFWLFPRPVFLSIIMIIYLWFIYQK